MAWELITGANCYVTSLFVCMLPSNIFSLQVSLSICICVTGGHKEKKRKENTTPLGVIQEKLMVNPRFPLA